MSYDITLVDPITKEPIKLDAPHFMRGGTYCVFGDEYAHLNITYNYSKHFREVFGDSGGGTTGIRRIYGLTGADSLLVLEDAIGKLGDDIDEDYWKPTEGNAKAALLKLLSLAKMCPDGIWVGD